jgi:quercetin dioxygenase-like cupin family protein
MFCFYSELESQVPAPGMTRKILARGRGLMAVEVSLEKQTALPLHTHPHEQVSYVVSGQVVFEIDGRKEKLGPGDSCYIAPNLPHGVVAGEKSVVLDVFTPPREDFLK